MMRGGGGGGWPLVPAPPTKVHGSCLFVLLLLKNIMQYCISFVICPPCQSCFSPPLLLPPITYISPHLFAWSPTPCPPAWMSQHEKWTPYLQGRKIVPRLTGQNFFKTLIPIKSQWFRIILNKKSYWIYFGCPFKNVILYFLLPKISIFFTFLKISNRFPNTFLTT